MLDSIVEALFSGRSEEGGGEVILMMLVTGRICMVFSMSWSVFYSIRKH